jgi:hypothetical protein
MYRYEGRASYLYKTASTHQQQRTLVDTARSPFARIHTALSEPQTSGPVEPHAIMYITCYVRQNAQVWTRPKTRASVHL